MYQETNHCVLLKTVTWYSLVSTSSRGIERNRETDRQTETEKRKKGV